MTQETRETLEQLYCYAASRAEWHPFLMPVTDPGWDEDDLAECVEQAAHWGRRALALRDVLTPRTCKTCRWLDHSVGISGGVSTAWHCGHESEAHPEVFGCTWWEAREGEAGER